MHHVVPFARTLEPYGGATWSWGEGCRLEEIYINIYIYIYIYMHIDMAYALQCIHQGVEALDGLWEGNEGRPDILGLGTTKKHILEMNWMVISGYLPL